jgi:hypothetical protein
MRPTPEILAFILFVRALSLRLFPLPVRFIENGLSDFPCPCAAAKSMRQNVSAADITQRQQRYYTQGERIFQ